MESENDSPISNFYKDKSVFITGATGFVGKVLVEKLLRSCDGIKNIYLLLRTKKGLDPKPRLEQLLEAKLFDKIKENNSHLLSKLIAIQGDITLPGLGISQNDLSILIDDVSIVFHSAASVKFDEPLKTAVNFNVLGTRRVLELCHQMPNLAVSRFNLLIPGLTNVTLEQALIHVSTAYANCNREVIEEVVYQTPFEPQKIIDSLEWMDDSLVSTITSRLLDGRPNTYTYTKSLAESLLVAECGDEQRLPAAIVRPSLVAASWREPFPGWVDSINGTTLYIRLLYSGLLRSSLLRYDATADLIPVDTLVNMLVAVAWHTAVERSKTVAVYHCTSGLVNRLTWREVKSIGPPILTRYPSCNTYRLPVNPFTQWKFVHVMCTYLDQLLPAYLSDLFLLLTFRKPK